MNSKLLASIVVFTLATVSGFFDVFFDMKTATGDPDFNLLRNGKSDSDELKFGINEQGVKLQKEIDALNERINKIEAFTIKQ